MTRMPKIQHPDWLRFSGPEKALELYLTGKLPKSIAGWMIVVGLKHHLRAVYGSDLRAALALLWDALYGPLEQRWYTLTHRKRLDELRRDLERGDSWTILKCERGKQP
jgi:hypothetical protein